MWKAESDTRTKLEWLKYLCYGSASAERCSGRQKIPCSLAAQDKLSMRLPMVVISGWCCIFQRCAHLDRRIVQRVTTRWRLKQFASVRFSLVFIHWWVFSSLNSIGLYWLQLKLFIMQVFYSLFLYLMNSRTRTFQNLTFLIFCNQNWN